MSSGRIGIAFPLTLNRRLAEPAFAHPLKQLAASMGFVRTAFQQNMERIGMAATSAPDFAAYRKAINDELQARIEEFRNETPQHRMPAAMVNVGEAPHQPLNIIAQGDSWFEYPLPPSFPLPKPSDIIAHLKAMPSSPNIISLAHHGEAAEGLLSLGKYEILKSTLFGGGANGSRFDAILFSGGGNDLVGDQFRLWLNDAVPPKNPAQGLNTGMVDAIMAVIIRAYKSLIALRDSYDEKVPIFTHSYDYAIPSGKGVCFTGPWILPSLKERGWDEISGRQIVKQLLIRFADELDKLAQVTKNFYHVKTQGTLTDNQWANELHPTPDGFAAIAAKFAQTLRSHPGFAGRI